jgi:hypothetical protein
VNGPANIDAFFEFRTAFLTVEMAFKGIELGES